MNPVDSTHASSSPEAARPPVLGYERIEPAGPRPRWVYGVVCVYLLLLSVLLTAPLWGFWVLGLGQDEIVTPSICVVVLLACGLSLTLIPVRVARRRRVTRRSIWIPVIASGLLAGGLVFGGGLALCEYGRFTDDNAGWMALIAGLLTWAGWSVLFALIAFGGREESVGLKLHRWLIAGSVLELLVAVPTHIIVRRRAECCAGILTGIGICIGVAVMIVSFGPSVLLLYHQRRKQITPRGTPAAADGRAGVQLTD
jgi:hypothetical protein